MLLRRSWQLAAPPAGQGSLPVPSTSCTACFARGMPCNLAWSTGRQRLASSRSAKGCAGLPPGVWLMHCSSSHHCPNAAVTAAPSPQLPDVHVSKAPKISQSADSLAASTRGSTGSKSSRSSSGSSSIIRYRCPTCGAQLLPEGVGLGCAEGHWVGRAKEGHVHLLPSGRKRALHAPGDSDAMVGDWCGLLEPTGTAKQKQVRARRAFFDAGHYSSVADAVAQAAMQASLAPAIAAAAGKPGLAVSAGNTASTLASTDTQRHAAALGPSAGDKSALPAPPGNASGRQASACLQRVGVLDAGCGEGRYLGCVGQALQAAGLQPECHGIDVSKTAVRLAARRYPDAAFAVASSYHLPYDDAVFDIVVSVFSPTPVQEFRRVLRRGGTLVVASPGRNHLAGIKRLLYRSPRPYQERLLEGPSLQSQVRVQEELTVGGADATKLLAMTPYYWKASQQQQRDLARLDELTTTVDIIVSSYLL